jgi:diguanylate cyclase
MHLNKSDIAELLSLSCTPTMVCDQHMIPTSANPAMMDLLKIDSATLPLKDIFAYFEDPQVIRTAVDNVKPDGPAYEESVSLQGNHSDDQYTLSVLLLNEEQEGLFLITLCPKAGLAESARELKLDSLTGLPRYDLFVDRIDQAMIAAQRLNKSVAILIIGIDQLDRINDGYGYDTGNRVLKETADRIAHAIRRSDTAARPFAEMFGLVMQITSVEDSVLVAQKMLNALGQEMVIDDHAVNVTASVGISLFPSDGDSAAVLIKNAESALRHVKQQGGNGHEFFSQDMNDVARHRIEMENSLRRALNNKEFVVYYQPKVNLEDNAVVGAEALIRWMDPDRGMISPGEFIPVAEETSLIGEIGQFVMETACRQNSQWQEKGLKPVRISVNFTADQFHDRFILDKVQAVLSETFLSPEYLELEITESTLVGDMDKVIDKLTAFRAMGLHVSIDDFGTGYSSLSYLSHFPITTLKIDRAFVKDMEVNSKTAEITNAIIGLSRGLSLEVVAEGAESLEHVKILRDKGCDLVQGFYFSRPLPADEFEKILELGYLYD